MSHFESLGKDLRFAVRSFLKSPGFSVVAILALALGIGANSAMFSVVDAILLKPLPYSKPERLVWLTQNIPMFKAEMATSIDYWEWRNQQQLFDEVAAYSSDDFNLVGGEEPERVRVGGVTASFFRTFGVSPSLGRTFTDDEDKPGGDNTVILLHGLFARHYGSNPGILGKTIQLDDKPYKVVGVMPADFRYPGNTEVTLLKPAQLKYVSAMSDQGVPIVGVVARMKAGVPIGRVRSELTQVRKADPKVPKEVELRVVPLHQHMVGDRRAVLLILFGAVGLVLLIACGNVANLLLARAADRRREIALRSALGAARGRLIRQLLTESLLLSVAGAALGLVIARFAVQAVVALAGTQLPLMENAAINPVVIGFTVAAALLTAILFGLAPALAVSKTDVIESLKQGGKARPRRRARSAFEVFSLPARLQLRSCC